MTVEQGSMHLWAINNLLKIKMDFGAIIQGLAFIAALLATTG